MVEGTLINDRKEIAKAYMKSWFIIDLLSSVRDIECIVNEEGI